MDKLKKFCKKHEDVLTFSVVAIIMGSTYVAGFRRGYLWNKALTADLFTNPANGETFIKVTNFAGLTRDLALDGSFGDFATAVADAAKEMPVAK